MTTKYQSRAFQTLYDSLLEAAKDRASELYHEGQPRRGAGHRAAFWDGYVGKRTANVIPNTFSAVAFAAGRAFYATKPGIDRADAAFK